MRKQVDVLVAVMTFTMSCVAEEQFAFNEDDSRYGWYNRDPKYFKEVEAIKRVTRKDPLSTERRLTEDAHVFSLLLLSLHATSPSAHSVGHVSPMPAHEPQRSTPILMNGKKVMYSDAARESLINGVNSVANAVKVTIGPRGRNVVINTKETKGHVVVINDGVSIAGNVELDLPEEAVGANLLLQACSQTDSRAGDGTTTAAVLTQAMCQIGKQYVSNGVNAVALQRGLIQAASFFVEKIKEAAEPVTTLEQYQDIASISANSDEMGSIVAEAVMRVGYDGAVTCDASKELTDSLEFAEGLEHEVGMVSDDFITDVETTTCQLDGARLFITDQKLTTMQDILPILEGALQSQEPVVIMALDVTGDALSGLKLNNKKGVIKCCVVKTPGFGDVRTQYLEDLCIFSGAKFCANELSMAPSKMTLADCGKVSKAVITKKSFLVVSDGTHDEEVEKRVKEIRELIETKISQGKEFEVQRLEQRINKLRGAVARIFIGAPTEAEIVDKRLRYEDAINALKGAVVMGRVPGGGACYAYMLRYADEARESIAKEDEKLGVDVLIEAMKEPIRMISNNAGLLGEMTLQTVMGKEWGYGFDAKILEYRNLLESGVCDPASVTTWALENSASIAGSLLTTEAMVTVTEKPPEEEEYDPEFRTEIDEDKASQMAW